MFDDKSRESRVFDDKSRESRVFDDKSRAYENKSRAYGHKSRAYDNKSRAYGHKCPGTASEPGGYGERVLACEARHAIASRQIWDHHVVFFLLPPARALPLFAFFGAAAPTWLPAFAPVGCEGSPVPVKEYHSIHDPD